jgi:hypothetical protein
MKKEIFPNIVKMNKERLMDAFVCTTLNGHNGMFLGKSNSRDDVTLWSYVKTFDEPYRNLLKSLERLSLKPKTRFNSTRKPLRRPAIYLRSYSVGKAEQASFFLKEEFSYRDVVPFEELSEEIFGKQADDRTLANILTCISVGTKTLDNGRKVCYPKKDSFKDYVDFVKEEILSSSQYLDGDSLIVPTKIALIAQRDEAFGLPETASARIRKACWVKTALLYATALEELRSEQKIRYRGVSGDELVYQNFDAPTIPLS